MSSDISLTTCPVFSGIISLFSSATATFHAPSDPSGIYGMCHEQIWATESWWQGLACYDCVFVNTHPELDDMRGLDVVCILAFFSFTYCNKLYPCALVHWYSIIGEDHDEDTGMWIVSPNMVDGSPGVSIIHLDTIFHAAHLLPSFGQVHLA